MRTSLRLLARDLLRDWSAVLPRLAWVALGTGALVAFVAVLPAYRASYTEMLESARFDQWVSGAIGPTEAAALAGEPGVRRATALLNVPGIGLRGSARASASVYAIDDASHADATIFAPSRLIAGRLDFGTPEHPAVVVGQGLARDLGVGVGDSFTLTVFASPPLGVHVAGITGSVFRLRGEGLLMRRADLLPLLVGQAELADVAYTDALISGVLPSSRLDAILGEDRYASSTKAELIAEQEKQIEVSSPVIEVVSRLAAVALIGLLALLAWQAVERRRAVLSLLPHLGAPGGQILAVVLAVDAAPAAVAAAVGTAVSLTIIVNGYFGNIGAFVAPSLVALASAAVVLVVLVCHGLALSALGLTGKLR